MPRPSQLRLNTPNYVQAFTDEQTVAKWRNEAAALRPVNARDSDETTITIYEAIGYDWWTGGGVTAKRINAALRSIGDRDVTVNINSPGGDVFEGIAILNELVMHSGKITVNVVGMAASAASFIAMAGDEINMAKGSYLMIHRAGSGVWGTDQDMEEVAGFLKKVTEGIAEIYAERGKGSAADYVAAMSVGKNNLGTWYTAEEAIEEGLADGHFDGDLETVQVENNYEGPSLRDIDNAMARGGMPRSMRRAFLNQNSGTQDAAPNATQDAGTPWADSASKLIASFRDG